MRDLRFGGVVPLVADYAGDDSPAITGTTWAHVVR